MTKAVKNSTPKAPRAPKAAKRTVAAPSQAPVSHGVGRRKKAVARIWLREGNGTVNINGRDLKEYFDTEITQRDAISPFKVCVGLTYNVEANVSGGGLCAQADAVKLGIARALVARHEDVRRVLREHGMLTVDSRVKERKKYGQKSARAKFQFVKR